MIVNDSKKLQKVAQQFYCELCDYTTCKKSSFDKHIATDKHKNMENGSKMVVNDSEKSPKVAKVFCCELCDYTTCKKCDYTKHLSTDKHKKATNDSKMVVNDSKKSPKVAFYTCECGKIYKYDSGYYRHKKVCNVIITPEKDETSEKELIMISLKDKHILLLDPQKERRLKILHELIKAEMKPFTCSNIEECKTYMNHVFFDLALRNFYKNFSRRNAWRNDKNKISFV
jgi:hypothetical protein